MGWKEKFSIQKAKATFLGRLILELLAWWQLYKCDDVQSTAYKQYNVVQYQTRIKRVVVVKGYQISFHILEVVNQNLTI